MKGNIIIAIETSFDDAAVAAIDGSGRIIAGLVAGQVELHREWGGVVPELAARTHLSDLPELFSELKKRIRIEDIGLVAVTKGPGLIGSLLIGVNFARGVALALDVPCVGLNHLEGHLVSPFLVTEQLKTNGNKADNSSEGSDTEGGDSVRENGRNSARDDAHNLESERAIPPKSFPASTPQNAHDSCLRAGYSLDEIPFPHLALVVSGGNTLLVRVDGLRQYEVCGETLDDAGGELLDKIAVALGRGYPGGAAIEKLAATVDPGESETAGWLKENKLPVPMRESGDLNFSYSGLKTAALKVIERNGITAGHSLEPLFCHELLRALVESLFIKVQDFVRENPDAKAFTVSGGVAANRTLVANLKERLGLEGISVYSPSTTLAVDNAEMMAYLAWLYRTSSRGFTKSAIEFDAEAGLRL